MKKQKKNNSINRLLIALIIIMALVAIFFVMKILIEKPTSLSPNATRFQARTDLPMCSDGIDNDGDGAIDYPADSGCMNETDDDESPSCFNPRWVQTGDAFFKEDPKKPNYEWLVENLDKSMKTEILGPTRIKGPLLGVGSSFDAKEKGQAYLSPTGWDKNKLKGWDLPNKYKSFVFHEVAVDDLQKQCRVSNLDVTEQLLKHFDSTVVQNVPQELQKYLKRDASVIKMKVNNSDGLPSIGMSSEMNFISRERYRFLGAQTDGDGWIVYLIYLNRVFSDGSINLTVVGFGDPDYHHENIDPYSIIIPAQSDAAIGDFYVYNYESKGYGQEGVCEGKDWAMVGIRYGNQENELLSVFPTTEYYVQTYQDENGVNLQLPFYLNVHTGKLEYPANVGYISGGGAEVSFVYYSHNYNDDFFGNPSFYLTDDNHYLRNGYYGTVCVFEACFPDGTFSIDGEGNIVALGNISEKSESFELWDLENIGDKQGNYKDYYGRIIYNPATNSLTDTIHYSIPITTDQAITGVHSLKNKDDSWYGWAQSSSLGVKTFFSTYKDDNIEIWLGLFNVTNYDNRLHLKQGTTYNDNMGDVYYSEDVLFGSSESGRDGGGPKAETSLTSGRDFYQDKVYVTNTRATDGKVTREKDPGYVDTGYNSGIKYLLSFDSRVDFRNVNEKSPLIIPFLDYQLQISGYKQEWDSKKNTYVEKILVGEYCGPQCTKDIDCNDGLFCSSDTCDQGKCVHQQLDCGDGRQCTGDFCNENLKKCTHDDSLCCTSDKQCQDQHNDSNMCNYWMCDKWYNQSEGLCSQKINKCDDGKKCTYDTCNPFDYECVFVPIQNCECEFNNDCEQGYACCPETHRCSKICGG